MCLQMLQGMRRRVNLHSTDIPIAIHLSWHWFYRIPLKISGGGKNDILVECSFALRMLYAAWSFCSWGGKQGESVHHRLTLICRNKRAIFHWSYKMHCGGCTILSRLIFVRGEVQKVLWCFCQSLPPSLLSQSKTNPMLCFYCRLLSAVQFMGWQFMQNCIPSFIQRRTWLTLLMREKGGGWQTINQRL